MIKLVLLLTSIVSINFIISFYELLGITQNGEPQEIEIIFTKSPIGVESGQPVYPISTKVFVKSSDEKEFTISVNGGKELKEKASKIELSSFIQPQANTYTVVVFARSENFEGQKIFGFTTK